MTAATAVMMVLGAAGARLPPREVGPLPGVAGAAGGYYFYPLDYKEANMEEKKKPVRSWLRAKRKAHACATYQSIHVYMYRQAQKMRSIPELGVERAQVALSANRESDKEPPRTLSVVLVEEVVQRFEEPLALHQH